MDASEYYDFEDRRYIQPTVSRDEQLSFADKLRDTMARDTAQINASTQALGTNIPSSMGGLTGSGSYFTQRYQTTPVESTVNTLRATAQAKALNDLMGNYEKQWANRAQQAYRRAKRRASAGARAGGSAEGEYNQSEGETGTIEYPGAMPMGNEIWGDRNVMMYQDIDTNYRIYKDSDTGEILQVLNAENKPIDQDKDPYYRIMSDGRYHNTDSIEYRNAVAQAKRNNAINTLGLGLLFPGFVTGMTIGDLINGK